MRININLASERYEAAQRYLRRMGTLVGMMAVVALLLVGYIVYQRRQTRDIDTKIAQAQQEISLLDNEKGQAQAILNQPSNRSIVEQSQFLNGLFARKSLSWTRIFSEMERIMPPSIHVVSMKPDYSNSNDLVVHVVVATDSRERAVELVKHMENSPRFRGAQVVAETVTNNSSDQGAGPGNIQFDIAAVYLPYAADVTDEEEKDSDKAAKTSNPGEKTATKAATTARNRGGPR